MVKTTHTLEAGNRMSAFTFVRLDESSPDVEYTDTGYLQHVCVGFKHRDGVLSATQRVALFLMQQSYGHCELVFSRRCRNRYNKVIRDDGTMTQGCEECDEIIESMDDYKPGSAGHEGRRKSLEHAKKRGQHIITYSLNWKSGVYKCHEKQFDQHFSFLVMTEVHVVNTVKFLRTVVGLQKQREDIEFPVSREYYISMCTEVSWIPRNSWFCCACYQCAKCCSDCCASPTRDADESSDEYVMYGNSGSCCEVCWCCCEPPLRKGWYCTELVITALRKGNLIGVTIGSPQQLFDELMEIEPVPPIMRPDKPNEHWSHMRFQFRTTVDAIATNKSYKNVYLNESRLGMHDSESSASLIPRVSDKKLQHMPRISDSQHLNTFRQASSQFLPAPKQQTMPVTVAGSASTKKSRSFMRI